jgi:phage replication O-like protein O
MLEALYQCKDLKLREYKLLLCMIRHTNGYNLNETILKNSYLVKETGISRSHICDTIQLLLKRDIIFKKEDSYGINKESPFWKNKSSLPREQSSFHEEQKFPLQGTTVPPRGNNDHPQTIILQGASSPLKTTLKKEIKTTSYKQEKYFKSRLHPILTNEEMDRYIKSQGEEHV